MCKEQKKLLQLYRLFDEQVNYIGLTTREKEISHLIVQGLLNKEIALILKLSERTVETHRNNIYKKLDVKNANELLHYYYEGLFEKQ